MENTAKQREEERERQKRTIKTDKKLQMKQHENYLRTSLERMLRKKKEAIKLTK